MSFKDETYKYSILIILSDSYINLGIVFLNSLYKNSNLKKINKIYVGN